MAERVIRLGIERRTFQRTHVEHVLDVADYDTWRGSLPDTPETLTMYCSARLDASALNDLTDEAAWSEPKVRTRLRSAAAAGAQECVFCRIADGKEPATVLADGISCVAIEPLNPVTFGHFIVIPREHVPDAYTAPQVTAQAMQDAAQWAAHMARSNPIYESVNFISSVGEPATQSVFHLHIHVVPRAVDDGLALPWYSGKRSARARASAATPDGA